MKSFLRVAGLVLSVCFLWGEDNPLPEAGRALTEGDGARAESLLGPFIAVHAQDAAALTLLAAALDAQKKFGQAADVYRRALALAPHSATLLNNFANHQLATGDRAGARLMYEKVLAIDPHHANANLQLALMASSGPTLDGKRGATVLVHLNQLNASDESQGPVRILRMRALFATGRLSEANKMLAEIERDSDPRISFSAGSALAADGRFAKAETLFARTLEKVPSDFDVLYNLGVAAARAKHYERAQQVLTSALAQRPEDVDTLANLAAVDIDIGQRSSALALLADAARLDPSRAATQKSLAETASALGYYADALSAYDRYLAKAPNDEGAHRERAFMLAASGDKQDGLQALLEYAKTHGHDATAQYEIGILQAQTDQGEAAVHLNRAVALDPKSVPARFGRGVLAFLKGDAAAALPDLQWAAERAPDNAAILDRLGEAELSLGRNADAVRVLRRASAQAPEDARVLMHLSRALAKNGESEEARTTLARFRAIGADRINKVPAAGFVEFLSLPPEQQEARYGHQVAERYHDAPDDPSVALRYIKLCLQRGSTADAVSAAVRLAASHPPSPLAAEAGHALLEAGQFSAAEPLLDAAGSEIPSAAIDAALVKFHTGGPVAGLQLLGAFPEAQHNAEYYLAQAQMLEAAERYDEADAAYRSAISKDPSRAGSYENAALFLARHGRTQNAVLLLKTEPAAAAEEPHSILVKAAVLSAAGHAGDAELLLKQLQNRWPEWPDPYVTYGILLEGQKRAAEAKTQLETALSLGADSTEVFYYLAKSTLDATPDHVDDAAKPIVQALALSPDDPGVQALAGRIDLLQKKYDSAIQHLAEAVRLRPSDLQTRFSLAQAYRAVGRQEDAARESAEFQRLRQLNPQSDDQP